MTKNRFCVQKGGDGVVRQKFMQGWMRPKELLDLLSRPSQLKKVKERYSVIIAEDVELQPCALRCKGCCKLVSLVQPHQTTKQHNRACTSPPEVDDDEEMPELIDEDDVEEEPAGKRKRSQSNTLKQFMPSAKLQDAVQRELLRAIITSDVAFKFANNKHLRRAFALVGVHLKDEKVFRCMVDEEFEDLQAVKNSELEKTQAFMVATDGWKSKHCEQGTGLVNCMVLKPHGGATFFRVLKTDDTQKEDASVIAEMHKELAAQLAATAGEGKLTAFIMDNCKTNRAACKILEQCFPTLLAYGCQVHALNLLVKDLAGSNGSRAPCPGISPILQSLLVISNVVSDSARIRSQLHQFQRLEYDGSIKVITPNSPTRWGCIIIIAQDVLKTRAALQKMVEDLSWEEVARSSRNAEELSCVLDSRWWQKLSLIMQLMQPIMDAMSQLEGDRAMLSQVPTAWGTLLQNAEAWVEKLPPQFAGLGEGVVDTFAERARKHHHPAFEAAYALDPLNFEKVEGLDEHAHPKILTQGDVVLDDIKAGVARLSGSNGDAVGEELLALDGGQSWTGAMKTLANAMCDREQVKTVSQRMRFWHAASTMAPSTSAAALKLMSMHASTAAAERNWSMFSRLYRNALRNNLRVDQAEKMVYIKANLAAGSKSDAVQLAMDTLLAD